MSRGRVLLHVALQQAARCVELASWLGHREITQPFMGLNGTDGPSYIVVGGETSPLEAVASDLGFAAQKCGVVVIGGSDSLGLPLQVPDPLAISAALWWPQPLAPRGGTGDGLATATWRVAVPTSDAVATRPSTLWHMVSVDVTAAPWTSEIDWPTQSRMFRQHTLAALARMTDFAHVAKQNTRTEPVWWRLPADSWAELEKVGGWVMFTSAAQLHQALTATPPGPNRLSAGSETPLGLDSDTQRSCRRLLSAGFSLLARSGASRSLRVESPIHVHDLT